MSCINCGRKVTDALKIYLASSWRNKDLVLRYAKSLREHGYSVDAFCDYQENCGERFVFDARDIKGWEQLNHKTALEHQFFRRAFEEDRKWLDWADICILILPCGNSAHIEAGYAKGRGKGLIILSPMLHGEWDVMYGFADYVLDLEEPKQLLDVLEQQINANRRQSVDSTTQKGGQMMYADNDSDSSWTWEAKVGGDVEMDYDAPNRWVSLREGCAAVKSHIISLALVNSVTGQRILMPESADQYAFRETDRGYCVAYARYGGLWHCWTGRPDGGIEVTIGEHTGAPDDLGGLAIPSRRA